MLFRSRRRFFFHGAPTSLLTPLTVVQVQLLRNSQLRFLAVLIYLAVYIAIRRHRASACLAVANFPNTSVVGQPPSDSL
jgi:hypothetical protein